MEDRPAGADMQIFNSSDFQEGMGGRVDEAQLASSFADPSRDRSQIQHLEKKLPSSPSAEVEGKEAKTSQLVADPPHLPSGTGLSF